MRPQQPVQWAAGVLIRTDPGTATSRQQQAWLSRQARIRRLLLIDVVDLTGDAATDEPALARLAAAATEILRRQDGAVLLSNAALDAAGLLPPHLAAAARVVHARPDPPEHLRAVPDDSTAGSSGPPSAGRHPGQVPTASHDGTPGPASDVPPAGPDDAALPQRYEGGARNPRRQGAPALASLSLSVEGAMIRVVVRGELDISNENLLSDVNAALGARPAPDGTRSPGRDGAVTRVELDLTGVTFADASTLRALVRLRDRTQAARRDLVILTARNGPIDRLLRLTKLDRVLTTEPRDG